MDAELFGSARFAWKEMAGGICFWISGTQTHYGPFFFRVAVSLCDATLPIWCHILFTAFNTQCVTIVSRFRSLHSCAGDFISQTRSNFSSFVFCVFFSLLFVCCQTRPVYYSIFHQKFYAHHFFFHSVHSHSPNANSSRGCFSTWLLTSISMEVMGVHKKERDSSEHEQDKATVMLLLVLLPLYIYIYV